MEQNTLPPSGRNLLANFNAPVANDGSYVLATDNASNKNSIAPNIHRMSVPDSSSTGNIFRTIISDKSFQNIIFALIVLNSLLMGISTADVVTQNPDVVYIFDALDFGFLILFTIELMFGFASYGFKIFQNAWLTFDFLVIAISWFHPTFQIIRGFRALRLLTRIKYVRLIVGALYTVLPVMGSIVVLLCVIFYVSAVIFTDLFGDMFEDGTVAVDYFGNLGSSIFTLFQVTTGAGWPEIAREIMQTYSWAWFPFVLFVSVTMFVVVELTVAALCQSVAKMEENGAIVSSAPVKPANDEENEDTRVLQLERKVDLLVQKLKVSNADNSMANPPRGVSWGRKTFSRSNPSSKGKLDDQQWYSTLALSFYSSPVLESTPSNDVTLQIEESYNFLPRKLQSLCGSIATNGIFQGSIIFLIVANSITMGVATYDFVKNDLLVSQVFDVMDMIFLGIFTFELIVQLGYRGSAFFKCGWLTFDFVIIVISWTLANVQVARSLRCFRLFSRVHFMRTIITALTMVASKLTIVAGLLLLMFYIMSVIFTDLFKGMYDDGLLSEDYFGSLGQTAFTLFQIMTISGWPDIAREVMQTYSWAWMPFISWILLSKFTIVQLIIAILCQSLKHVDEEFSEENAEESEDKNSVDVDPVVRLQAKFDSLTRNVDKMIVVNQKQSSSSDLL